jgi:uncharacterized protein YndB with AHSA1/START domain
MANDAAGVVAIDLTLDTGADADLVWRTLTEPERVELWLADVTPIRGVGSPYRIDFGDGSVVAGEIVVADPGHVLGYTWAWEDAEPGEVTRVTWTLEPRLGGTRIRLVHDGWAEAGLDQAVRDDHEGYWSGYLDDLRDVLDEA